MRWTELADHLAAAYAVIERKDTAMAIDVPVGDGTVRIEVAYTDINARERVAFGAALARANEVSPTLALELNSSLLVGALVSYRGKIVHRAVAALETLRPSDVTEVVTALGRSATQVKRIMWRIEHAAATAYAE